MKRLSIISALALAFVFNACEKHPTSDAPGEEAKEFGKYEKGEKGGEGKSEAKPAAEPTVAKSEAAKPEAAAATPMPKPGEAPKFFPENK